MGDVSNNINKNNESYNFLLLSLYFYLKKNNFNETSEKLFQECKLDSIFKFPQNLKSPKSDKEKLTNEFIEFFTQILSKKTQILIYYLIFGTNFG